MLYKKMMISLAIFCTTLLAEDRIGFLLGKLYETGPQNYAIIIAHRGDWRYAPENSLMGFENCIKSGFDAIEIDVRLTKDSVLIIMHDETVNRTTNGKGKVSDLTLEEIKKLKLKTPTNYISNQQVPTFEEVLELTKGKILIYVDKWQKHRELVLDAVHKHNMEKQILLPGSTSIESEDYKIAQIYSNVNYIPFFQLNGKNDEKRFEDIKKKMNPIGFYFAFQKDSFPILEKTSAYSNSNHRFWIDTLLGKCCNGGKNDELALENEESSYGWLWEHGFSVFFTDNPHRVDSYFKSRGLR